MTAETRWLQTVAPFRIAVKINSSLTANWNGATVMAYVIAEPCIGTKDAACGDACPGDCIHPKKDEPQFEGGNILLIDPVECIDCGARVAVCPGSAIFALDDLPANTKPHIEINPKSFGR